VNGHHVLEADTAASTELRELLTQEQTARERAEYTANELARIVANEMRRAETERLRRLEVEERVEEMAALVAFEYSRAEDAEARLRALGY
jgi:hypothetical protein